MEFALDRKPTEFTLIARQHSNDRSSDLKLNRRRSLKLGVASIVAASLPSRLLHAQSEPQSCAPPIPQGHAPSNGGPCPQANTKGSLR